MVKAKKMSNDIKKYIKYVKKIIPIHSKDKKEFIQLLTQKIIEFSNEHDSCSYQDIVVNLVVLMKLLVLILKL